MAIEADLLLPACCQEGHHLRRANSLEVSTAISEFCFLLLALAAVIK